MMNHTSLYYPIKKPKTVLYFHEIGHRPYQEDMYFISPDHKLFIVCDGVGGSNEGGNASKKIINTISTLYAKAAKGDIETLIKYLIVESNKALFCEGDSPCSPSSTTLALVYIDENKAYFAHIGDSRIFYINPKLREWWMSKDHSFVQELYDAGIIESEHEMKSHPLKSRITRAITNDTIIGIDDIQIEKIDTLKPGDIMLVCSDGALERLISSDVVEIFTQKNVSFEESFNRLKDICTEFSKDNYTAIGIKF